jgi:hypothetical protein
MAKGDRLPGMSRPAAYRIRLQGELDADWSDWLEGVTITTERGVTTLTCTVLDQAALHGLLIRIRNLGLPLLSVNLVEEAEGQASQSAHGSNSAK